MTQYSKNLVLATAALALLVSAPARVQAQAQPQSAPAQTPDAKPQPKPSEGGENPFAPPKAEPLPPGMTGSDPKDPRANLKPGVYDAGEAIFGLEHVSFVKKPTAFQLQGSGPDDPSVQKALGALGIPPGAKIPPSMTMVLAGLSFANSDMAFQGNRLFLGNFYGLSFWDITNPSSLKLVTTLVCPGGQGDVSVYKNLLFMSVEMPNGRLDCGEQAFPPNPPPAANATDEEKKKARMPAPQKERFRGVRIFDITDLSNPKQVAAVQTCRGSHTHTLVQDPKDPDNVYIYVSETSFVRQGEELAGCSNEKPDKDTNTSLFKIDVIKVPVAHPEQAAIVSSPRVFMDPRSGNIAGLDNGGSHEAIMGKKGDKGPVPTDQCHDITAYSAIGLAAGACSGNGLLLDIKDPVNPKRVDAVNDPNYSYWHSASFSNDGSKVVFTDEWGGGMAPRCRATDPNVWGADAIFNIKNDDKLAFAGYYKMPAAQGDTKNCVAHNGSLVPVPGRDIEVQAWYQGGVSIMDFTDPAHPFEIAYFDRGPIDDKQVILGGYWSAYWYNGHIYGSEIHRGLDVFALQPTKFLTQNEIDAANQVMVSELNVQNQQKIEWPQNLTTAKAYVDQLERSQGLSAKKLMDVKAAIAKAQKSSMAKKQVDELKKMAASVKSEAASAKTPADAKRISALADIMENPQA